MKTGFFLTLVILLLLPPEAFAAKPEEKLREIARKFSPCDVDRDGHPEIAKLRYLKLPGVQNKPLDDSKPLVLVLVEDRILKRIKGSEYSIKDVQAKLAQFKTDLTVDGFQARFIESKVYSGEKHQDGLTLLAMRRFLIEAQKETNLQGVILVGSFPEATIVRRWIWKRKNWNVNIAGTNYSGDNQIDFLRIVPEPIATRADIVLADLDGNWESIYVREKVELEAIEAIPAHGSVKWPVTGGQIDSLQFNDRKVAFEDFFFVKEDQFERLPTARGRLKLKVVSTKMQNPEVGKEDSGRPNPIAVPEILVSRINARQVAVIPNPKFRDSNRMRLLDEDGEPQSFSTKEKIRPLDLMTKDAAFERELLVRYFERNHQFRTAKKSSVSRRSTSVHYGSGLVNATDLNKYLEKAIAKPEPSVAFNHASLINYVKFLKTPSRLKGFSAHSNPWNTVYGKSYNLQDLKKVAGGKPWRWKIEKTGKTFTYIPSFEEQGGAADSYLHRTIYENDVLKDVGGSLFLHLGCDVNTPGNALKVPYNHNDYGTSDGFQNAESILFFLNGVALASRSKVFGDQPRGFTDELGSSSTKCFGDGWKAYFEVESADAELAKDSAASKRTYPWSIIGDWTLRVEAK
jgi:hypothetical protein